MERGEKDYPETEELLRHQQTFIENQNHCALCGTELTFKVIQSQQAPHLKETASCPKCQITTRTKDHTVH